MASYILIIGAMKSGTTSLFATLAQHPQIAAAHPKEPGFFAFDDVHAQGLDWYHGLFDFDPKQHTYRLDGSTDYTKVPFVSGVRERIADVTKARFRLIYVIHRTLYRIAHPSRTTHPQRNWTACFASGRSWVGRGRITGIAGHGLFARTGAEEETLLSLLPDDLQRLQTRYRFDVKRRWGL